MMKMLSDKLTAFASDVLPHKTFQIIFFAMLPLGDAFMSFTMNCYCRRRPIIE